MESEENDIQVDFADGRLHLSLKVDERLRRISDDLCNLCIELSTSSSPDVPCMIFVKPFSLQLQWNSVGNLDLQIIEISDLSSWPLRIFRPVFFEDKEPVLFGSHLFGIDHLVNPSLAGFNPSEELIGLLRAQHLGLRSTNSQLMIFISDALKNELSTHRCLPQSVPTGIWKFCLHCIPDPHAEPMWQSNYGLLQRLFYDHVLPKLLQLIPEDSKLHITGRSSTPIYRALYAYALTTTSNRVAVYKYMSSLSSPSNASPYFQKYCAFLETVLRLESSLYAYIISFDDTSEDPIFPESVCPDVKSLLLDYRPYGHLAVLGIIKHINEMEISGSSFQVKNELANSSIQMLLDQSNTQIDRYLKAALAADYSILRPKESLADLPLNTDQPDDHNFSLKELTEIIAIANVSIYFSQMNMFSAAIPGYRTTMRLLRNYRRFSLQFELIITCELMKCLNAVGEEGNSVRTMILALARVRCDPFLHLVLHLRPELKLGLLDFQFPSPNAASCTVEELEMSLTCRPTPHSVLLCSNCSKISCRDCGGRNYALHGSQSTSSQYMPTNGLYDLTARVPKASSMSFATRDFIQDIPEMVSHNFDTFINLRIILADAYIGQASYHQAEIILEALLDVESVAQSEYGCFAALRLSKTIRRQNATLPKIATYNKVIRLILQTLSKVSASNEIFCFDEVESILLETSRSYNRSSEVSSGSRSVEALRQQLQQLLRGGEDRVIFNPSPMTSQTELRQVESVVGLNLKSSELSVAKHHDILGSVRGNIIQDYKPLVPDTALYRQPQPHSKNKARLASTSQSLTRSPENVEETSQKLQGTKFRHTPGECITCDEYGYHIEPHPPKPLPPNIGMLNYDSIASSISVATTDDKNVINVPFNLRGNDSRSVGESGPREALQSAARGGDVETVRQLLDSGVDIETRSIHGTPLHRAVLGEHLETVVLLLSTGANVNAETSDGTTPLHIAAISGYDDIVQLLLGYKNLRINARDTSGDTPLHGAVVGKHERIVQLLLENGAIANAKNHYNETPYQRAKIEGYEWIAELLQLDYGYNGVEINDREGTRIHQAAARGYRRQVQESRGRGAKRITRARNADQKLSGRLISTDKVGRDKWADIETADLSNLKIK